MIILGVGVGVLVVVLIGLSVARKVDGDSTNFLVAGRSLALPLTAAGLMGQAVDTNATLGNTDLSAAGGFWAGASLPIGLADLPGDHRALFREADEQHEAAHHR